MIILMRHASPIIDHSRCGFLIARERMNQYNSTQNIKYDEIQPLQKELRALLSRGKSIKVYTSELPRAHLTAKYIFESVPIGIKKNSIFSEFNLNVLTLPLIILTPKQWFVLSRVAWFFNFGGKYRSFRQENLRAKQAAKLLIESHEADSIVVLIGHSLINRFIKRSLKKKKWNLKERKKSGCFEVEYLEISDSVNSSSNCNS